MLRIITQAIIVPTFVAKVAEYLCFGGFFFRQISTFYLAIFDGIFYHSKSSGPELKFGKIFTSDIFCKL